MSYVRVPALGAPADPFALFQSKLTELRQAKAEEAAGTRPPSPLSTIPGYCWDQPGFKDCHVVAFRAAQADCESQGKLAEGNKCIGPLADHYSMNACPCKQPSLAEGIFGNKWLVIGGAAALAYVLVMPKTEQKAKA